MKYFTFLILCLFAASMAQAQWTTDTAVNTLVDNTVATDSQSLVNSHGETVIVFWKNLGAPEGHDLVLYVQKLDANGNKLFGEAGKLISNTIPMSSFTQQWSLKLDANDNIYVGVTGTDGNGGYAFKLNSNGDNQWTSDGISLGIGYVVKTLPLASGEVLISWFDNSIVGNIQKYDASGTAVWSNPVTLGATTIPANMFELTDGGFTVIYHEILSGITTKLIAQRFNAMGTSQWTDPTELFAAGNNTVFNINYDSLQDGDVIYYSYKLAHDSRFDAYVQRIDPDGTLPWGITGMDFDTNETNFEQDLQLAMSSGSQHIYALCNYTNSAQDQVAVYLQKFDKTTGARLLTDNAKQVYALGSGKSPQGPLHLINDQPIFLTISPTENGTILNMTLLDTNGDFVWAEESKPVATYENDFIRFASLNKISDAELVSVFVEDKGDGDKVYAQYFTDAALSVDEFSPNSSLQFINPIQNELKLKSDQTINAVKVYNNLGQLVSTIKNNSSNELTLNAQSWTTGLYLVSVNTGQNQTQSIKIVKR